MLRKDGLDDTTPSTPPLSPPMSIVEFLMHFNVSFPFLARDAVIHAFGCDTSNINDSFMILGKSVETWRGETVPKLSGWTQSKMDVSGFNAQLTLVDHNTVHTSIIVNLNPRVPGVPVWMVNFVMKNMAGVLLYFLQRQVKATIADATTEWSKRIRSDPFYMDWLLPKYLEFAYRKGWTLPCIPSLGESIHIRVSSHG